MLAERAELNDFYFITVGIFQGSSVSGVSLFSNFLLVLQQLRMKDRSSPGDHCPYSTESHVFPLPTQPQLADFETQVSGMAEQCKGRWVAYI